MAALWIPSYPRSDSLKETITDPVGRAPILAAAAPFSGATVADRMSKGAALFCAPLLLLPGVCGWCLSNSPVRAHTRAHPRAESCGRIRGTLTRPALVLPCQHAAHIRMEGKKKRFTDLQTCRKSRGCHSITQQLALSSLSLSLFLRLRLRTIIQYSVVGNPPTTTNRVRVLTGTLSYKIALRLRLYCTVL